MILMLFISRDRTERMLAGVRDWLIRKAIKLGAALAVLVALLLLRYGIAGLTN